MKWKHKTTRERRRTDGSLDFEYYRRRAVALRRGRIRYFLRRHVPLRLALYAGALCVGLAIGKSMPIEPTDCVNCQQADVDIDAARRDAMALDGFVAVVSREGFGRRATN